MPVFRPPTADTVPPVDYRRSGAGYWLFRHYKPRACGRTVLKHEDGTYTTVDVPSQDECDAAAAVYVGGNIYPVSDDEAALLVAAGYGDNVS